MFRNRANPETGNDGGGGIGQTEVAKNGKQSTESLLNDISDETGELLSFSEDDLMAVLPRKDLQTKSYDFFRKETPIKPARGLSVANQRPMHDETARRHVDFGEVRKGGIEGASFSKEEESTQSSKVVPQNSNQGKLFLPEGRKNLPCEKRSFSSYMEKISGDCKTTGKRGEQIVARMIKAELTIVFEDLRSEDSVEVLWLNEVQESGKPYDLLCSIKGRESLWR